MCNAELRLAQLCNGKWKSSGSHSLSLCRFYRHSMDDGWKPAVESSVEHQILIFTMNESILIFSDPEASNDLICALILSSSHRKLILSHISVPLRFNKLYWHDKKSLHLQRINKYYVYPKFVYFLERVRASWVVVRVLLCGH